MDIGTIEAAAKGHPSTDELLRNFMLALLAGDDADLVANAVPVPEPLVARMKEMVGGIDVDLDAPLSPEDV